MAESTALLKRRGGQTSPRVRIPASPFTHSTVSPPRRVRPIEVLSADLYSVSSSALRDNRVWLWDPFDSTSNPSGLGRSTTKSDVFSDLTTSGFLFPTFVVSPASERALPLDRGSMKQSGVQ